MFDLFNDNAAIQRRYIVSERGDSIIITREQKYIGGDWHDSHRLILHGGDLQIAANGGWSGAITQIDYGNAVAEGGLNRWGALVNTRIAAGSIDDWLADAIDGDTDAALSFATLLFRTPTGIQGNAERNIIRADDDIAVQMTTFNGGGGDDYLALAGTYRRGWVFNGQSGHDTFSLEISYGGVTIDAATGTVGNIRNAPLFTVFSIEEWVIESNDVRFDGATSADKIYAAGQGRDTLFGGGGNDTLTSVSGDDNIYGGAGDDTVMDRVGNDMLYGGAGFDILDFAMDNNFGGRANPVRVDLANGSASLTPDRPLYDGGGNKTIAGFEAVRGDAGDDTMAGDAGANTLWGRWGNDALRGRAGADRLFGEGGDDALSGGAGRDRLNGGLGDNTLTGGADRDSFVFSTARGRTTITDFDLTDRLVFTAGSGLQTRADVLGTAQAINGDVRISLPSSAWILLQNLTLADLRQADLLFS